MVLPKSTSMAELAKALDVSPMTVSRVLSGTPGKVAAATRERVLQEAKRRKMEVNFIARSHFSKRSQTLGVVTPFEGLLGSEYFAGVVAGIRSCLPETEWGLALFDTRAKTVDCGEMLDRYFRQRRVDGFLVVAPSSEDAFIEVLNRLEAPTVLIGEIWPEGDLHCVDVDPQPGMWAAMETLYEMGHREFGFLRGPETLGAAERRWQVFQQFLGAVGLRLEPSWCPMAHFSRARGHAKMREILKLKDRPTAVLAANDLMALGALTGAVEMGVSVPGDISVVGFDAISESAESFPRLSTINHPVKEVGRRAGEILLALLNGEKPTREGGQLLPSEFKPGFSHGPRKVER